MDLQYIDNGLNSKELEQCIANGDINTPPKSATRTTWQIIRDNLFTLFNAFNLIIGIGIAAVGAYTSLFFLFIIAINVSIGILQELRAKKMVEELSITLSPKTKVIRNGSQQDILNENIVLGDLMILSAGSYINSDAQIVDGEIECNESMLTGESDAILKKNGAEILSGSFVVSGKCKAKVIRVGPENYANKLTQTAKTHKPLNSELMKALKTVTKITAFFIIPIGLILFYQAFFVRGDIIKDSVVMTSAALLGMLPKGLALLTSISLAIGVMNLARKRTLVQELYCIENMAYIDVLCLDKTGTLTEGKMHVSDISIIDDSTLPKNLNDMMSDFLSATDDNNATYEALCSHFSKSSTLPNIEKRIPFSSERKWSSVSFTHNGSIIVGAPDIIFPNYNIDKNILRLQEDGIRLLMIGYTPQVVSSYNLPNIIPVALIMLSDPIRQNVNDTLQFFANEGIDIKVISGDNPKTVSAIAKKAGVKDAENFVDASSLENESDLKKALKTHSVFGRVTPSQKAQMVKLLQSDGHRVAMTGDGVNDVLALRNADCSIAMGEGSNAARQISQLVLLDSQFESVKDAMLEGRRVMNNMIRSAGIFYIKTIYSVVLSIVCILFNIPFPFLPIQVTLMDLALEGYPSFFMAFEPNYNKVKGKFLPTVLRRALPTAIIIVFGIVTVNSLYSSVGLSQSMATTLMYYITSISTIALILWCAKPLNKFRAFLMITMTIGFYFATILFKGLLHLDIINGTALIIFLLFTVAIYPLTLLMQKIVNGIWKIK